MVSVVITTYKRAPEILRRAIDSVRGQTYTDWELIVVDDSPESYQDRPRVRELVEASGDARIRYIAHEVNQGACAARNTGLEAARGAYIAYLDDDDEWLPEKLALQVRKAEQCGPGTALIYCGSVTVNDAAGTERVKKQSWYRGNIYPQLILDNFVGSTSFPLIRRECLIRIGGFDEQMQSAQDADVWLRLTGIYEADYVKEPLVRYHVHGGERITTDPMKKIAGLERLNQKNDDYIREHPEAFWVRNIRLAYMYARGGIYGKAFHTWGRAVRKCPWKVKGNLRYLALMLRDGKRQNRNQ